MAEADRPHPFRGIRQRRIDRVELTGLPAKASRLEPRIRAEIEAAVEELTELRALLHSIRRR